MNGPEMGAAMNNRRPRQAGLLFGLDSRRGRFEPIRARRVRLLKQPRSARPTTTARG